MLIRHGVDFVEQPTKLEPYFVGLWIAEGTMLFRRLRGEMAKR